MGQKVNPVGFRTGVVMGWKSRWYASKQEFAELLLEDQKIRHFIKDHPKRTQYRSAGIDRIEVERTRDEVKVILFVARPGLIIGKKGQEVELLQEELQNLIGRRVNLKIEEITHPEVQAQLVAEDIAQQLSKRASFRRTMKQRHGTDHGRRRQGDQDPVGRPTRRGGNGAARETDCGINSAEYPAGGHRLRVHRSDDGPRAYWRSSVDQSRHVRGRSVRWL